MNLKLKVGAAAGVLVAAWAVVSPNTNPLYYPFTYRSSVTRHVTDGERDPQTGNFKVYSDEGTVENKDMWWMFKVNSGDLQGALMKKGEFECSQIGARRYWPITQYPNLIRCTAVAAAPAPAGQ